MSALERNYGITSGEVIEFAGGVSASEDDPEEIVMIMAADSKSAEHIQAVLEERRQKKYDEKKDTDPEQAEMIDGCSVDRHGMYIAMFISEKADKMREIYNTLLEF